MSSLSFFIYAFTSIFVIVNPVSGVLTFEALTSGLDSNEKNRISSRAVWIACIMALTFALAGDLILKIFGITADSLRVAGGILLFRIAMDMLQAKTSREGMTPEELRDATSRDDISVFPVATPLLTGPGAITTIIVLMRTGPSLDKKIITVAAVLITFGITYLIFRFANKIVRSFGITASLVINRIMGLLLGAIAVNFVTEGIWNIYLSFQT